MIPAFVKADYDATVLTSVKENAVCSMASAIPPLDQAAQVHQFDTYYYHHTTVDLSVICPPLILSRILPPDNLAISCIFFGERAIARSIYSRRDSSCLCCITYRNYFFMILVVLCRGGALLCFLGNRCTKPEICIMMQIQRTTLTSLCAKCSARPSLVSWRKAG